MHRHAACRRFLNFEEALIHGERAALLGLLEDCHRLSDGLPPAGTTLVAGARCAPYLPYREALQVGGGPGGGGGGLGRMQPSSVVAVGVLEPSGAGGGNGSGMPSTGPADGELVLVAALPAAP